MGINPLSWKRIRALNRRLDERFVHVYTYSHHEHWIWVGLRYDGSAAAIDTRTWSVTPTEIDSTTVELLRSRWARTSEQAEWLDTLHRRYVELIVDWVRRNVVPPLSEEQLTFLGDFLGKHGTNNRPPPQNSPEGY